MFSPTTLSTFTTPDDLADKIGVKRTREGYPIYN